MYVITLKVAKDCHTLTLGPKLRGLQNLVMSDHSIVMVVAEAEAEAQAKAAGVDDMVSSCAVQKVLRSCRFILIPTYKMRSAGAIFEFAVSPKYYLHFNIPLANLQPTTHNTEQPKCTTAALPSSGVALSLHG
jgi:hypothetical protein